MVEVGLNIVPNVQVAKEVPAPTKPTEIKIVLPTNAYFMSGIRDFTLSMIRNMTDFSEQWAYRFQSVVDELCNNAIEHGSSNDDTIEIRFVNYKDDAIEIIVSDHGTGPNQLTADQVRARLAQNAALDITQLGIRGRGLTKIVKEWTDELDITDNKFGGITVRVKKYLHDERFAQVGPGTDPTHIVLDV
ncbi:hypothetical protein COY06_01865 [Candidatus Peregrinibacteria bacterium CG_4_10_14_0_2_um_filter_41_8]|nr:MAG: hypothetical protein COY06_01865 [Candidatus Peregrinibacteria bacterium CG_4_10_14_0_2_um_filter_41_8]